MPLYAAASSKLDLPLLNNQTAQSILKQDYKDDITREEAVQLALKVLNKTMDITSLTPALVPLGSELERIMGS
ncbi:hypothetical protein IFM89_031024 [Coptis chinensis]|uniref:Uncharacterized protein n=1 Tax=Coptis chinensis TaxID=261450 RepID=A0A835H9Z8_9MAGN|nr:hypothetical protein IFM89_031024 [Coptis chinensis]